MEKYIKTSEVTGKQYNLFGIVRILNLSQAAFYMKNGILPVHIEIGESKKDGSDCLVFYFNKDETKPAYEEWCSRRTER